MVHKGSYKIDTSMLRSDAEVGKEWLFGELK